jgi:hypothetical protein
MAKKHRKGDKVSWKWGNGTAEATVQESFTERVERTLNGSKIVRNGSEDDPAYLLEQDDGAQVLKLHSELS